MANQPVPPHWTGWAQLMGQAEDEMEEMLERAGASDQLLGIVAGIVGARALAKIVAVGVGELFGGAQLQAADLLRHRLQAAFIDRFHRKWTARFEGGGRGPRKMWQEFRCPPLERDFLLRAAGWDEVPVIAQENLFQEVPIEPFTLIYLPGMSEDVGRTMVQMLRADIRQVIFVAPTSLYPLLLQYAAQHHWNTHPLADLTNEAAEYVGTGEMVVYWSGA